MSGEVTSEREIAVIVGAGPGLGAAMARRFAPEGMEIVLAARQTDKFSGLMEEISRLGSNACAIGCDATRERTVTSLFKSVRKDLGIPSLVVYNIEHFSPGNLLDIEVAAFEECWRAMCLGAFIVGREAARLMLAAGQGTIIYTGATAAMRGRAGYINMTVGKSGIRALAQSMARELGPKGIHVAHVVIDGGILSPNSLPDAETRMSSLYPSEIARTIFHLHRQHRSAWTQELDLRPWVENF